MDQSAQMLVTVITGGALIGLAAGLLTILTGRVMTASGMIGSLLGGAEGVAATSIAFIGGIAIAPSVMTGLGFAPVLSPEARWPLLVMGGLLIGIGARFGGASLGGTITGISQGQGRSVAGLLAIVTGIAAAVALRQIIGSGGAA